MPSAEDRGFSREVYQLKAGAPSDRQEGKAAEGNHSPFGNGNPLQAREALLRASFDGQPGPADRPPQKPNAAQQEFDNRKKAWLDYALTRANQPRPQLPLWGEAPVITPRERTASQQTEGQASQPSGNGTNQPVADGRANPGADNGGQPGSDRAKPAGGDKGSKPPASDNSSAILTIAALGTAGAALAWRARALASKDKTAPVAEKTPVEVRPERAEPKPPVKDPVAGETKVTPKPDGKEAERGANTGQTDARDGRTTPVSVPEAAIVPTPPEVLQKVAADLPPGFTVQDMRVKLDEMIGRERTKGEEADTKLVEHLETLKTKCESDPQLSSRVHELLTRTRTQLAAGDAGSAGHAAPVSNRPLENIGGATGTVVDGVIASNTTGDGAVRLPADVSKEIDRQREELTRKLAELDEKRKTEPRNEDLARQRAEIERQMEDLQRAKTDPVVRGRVVEWLKANGSTVGKGVGAAALFLFIYSVCSSNASASERADHARIKSK